MAAEPDQVSIGNDLLLDRLEKEARWQRAELQDDLSGLKLGLHEILDAKHVARKYLWQVAVGAAVLALLAGYSFAGIFTRDRERWRQTASPASGSSDFDKR
jgi:hypothetical protein